MTFSGTVYVTDSAGTAVDVSLTAEGQVAVCVLAEGDEVAKFDYDEVQALIDALTFFQDAADKYGVNA